MATATLTNNATTVAKMYEAFGRGDIPTILNNIADDCTFIGAGEGSLPQGGTYVGKNAVQFFQKLGENLDFNAFNVTSINNTTNDEVVAFGDMKTTSKNTGKKVSADWTMHWKFNEEGKAIYFHDFFDTAAAYFSEQDENAKEQNINTVKLAFDNFLKGDVPAILNACTDDIEWGSHNNPTVPYGRTYHGKAGAAEFFKTLSDSVNYTRFEPKEYYADRNKVFVEGYHEAKIKSTGKTFGHDFVMEFTIRDGKVSKFFAYVDTNDQARAFQP
jgi:uncharacterized protein